MLPVEITARAMNLLSTIFVSTATFAVAFDEETGAVTAMTGLAVIILLGASGSSAAREVAERTRSTYKQERAFFIGRFPLRNLASEFDDFVQRIMVREYPSDPDRTIASRWWNRARP